MTKTPCDRCGQPIRVGAWPFCPHGPAGGFGVIDDTLPGGARWMHNLGDTPVWVETKTELAREMRQRGLVPSPRAAYSKDDRSPYSTRHRLRPGQRDPFLHRADENV